MRKILNTILFLISLTWHSLTFAALPLPNNLIALASPAGTRLLQESPQQQKFLALITHYTAQKTQTYCSIATSAIVLNALKIPAPIDPAYKPYAYFTQDDFFTPAITQIIAPEEVGKHGMDLATLGKVLATFPLQVQIVHASEVSLPQFRSQVVMALKKPRTVVIANFLRSAIQEQGGGHFSPIAAYNKRTDRFLILDVAPYKYPAMWVTAQDLLASMQTIDTDSKISRGFIIASASEH